MSKELDNIIEIALNDPGASTALRNAKAVDKEGLSYPYIRDLAKTELTNRIYKEIKEELKEQIIKEAQDEIDKKSNLKQIQEIKALTISGAMLAIFVGLFVNQITELIDFYKGPIKEIDVQLTWKASIVLLGLTSLITVFWFFRSALKVIKDYSEKGS